MPCILLTFALIIGIQLLIDKYLVRPWFVPPQVPCQGVKRGPRP